MGQEPPPTSQPTSEQPNKAQAAAFGLLLLALKSLSQRTVVALASLASLAMAASVFTVWFIVIENPTTLKLIGAGLYSSFALLWEYLRAK
jgi:hypothetical protein